MARKFFERLQVGVLLTFFLVLVGMHPAQASSPEIDPLSQIKGSVQEVLRILRDEGMSIPDMRVERKRRVEAIVDRVFDFREMSRYTLANYWEERTPEEQDRFVGLFAKLVKQRYLGKIDNYSGQEVFFKKQLVKGDRALIYTVLQDNGAEIPIIYKLVMKEDRWRVYDMKIESVSLVSNYRVDFFSVIKRESYSGLVETLEKKVRENADLW